MKTKGDYDLENSQDNENNSDNGIVNVAFDTKNPDGNQQVIQSDDNEKFKNNGQTNGDSQNIEAAEEPTRLTFGRGIEFLMSCISMSVGLGNVWRFPFTAYENGGGAFLIPYIIVLILIGKPFYYLEMIMGQFSSRGSVKMWQILPALKGVGIGQMLACAGVVTYYCSLIALTLFYMFRSFAAELPWSRCWNTWTESCVNSALSISDSETKVSNTSSSSELYFLKEVIKEKDHIDDGLGAPDWEMTLWLLLAWLILYVIIVKGVRTSGKVAYFTAIFPYIILVALLIHAVTLEGSAKGILYFITPNWSSLLDPKVWYNAVTQLFFSLTVGFGAISMFSSYNKFDHNIYRDALIVTTLDTFTSLLAGFTIFAILGNLAHNIGEDDMSKVIKSGGSGLAFISYPDAISKFKAVPQLFSVLFFFMLFTLGIGSGVALQSAIVTNIMDHLPTGKFKHWQIAGIACVCGFLVGLVYVTPGGQWMLTLIDHFAGTFLVFALAILELVGIISIYGLDNFCWDIEFMLHRPVTIYWRWSWAIVTPLLMIIIFVYQMANLENPTYGPHAFPTQYLVAGWIVFSIGALQILVWSLWSVNRSYHKIEHSTLLEATKKSFTSSSDWGPKIQKLKLQWIEFKVDAKSRKEIMIQTENHSKVQQFFYSLSGRYGYL